MGSVGVGRFIEGASRSSAQQIDMDIINGLVKSLGGSYFWPIWRDETGWAFVEPSPKNELVKYALYLYMGERYQCDMVEIGEHRWG